MNNKVCLFGGTFNPIHNGHIVAAYLVKEKFNFDKFIFIPNNIPPHRQQPSVSAIDRYNMINIALENTPFEVSNYEIQKDNTSYFIDTVHYFKQKYKNLYMLIGSDQANRFRMWYNWEKYFDIIKIIVIDKNEPLFEILPFIYYKEFIPFPISSTQIRDRIKNGKDIIGFVPEKVINYIRKNGLYK